MMLSFAFVTLVVVCISIYTLYSHQRDFLYAQSIRSTTSLAQTLAFSSASWVVAADVVGLQEVLQGADTSEDLKFALILSPRGKVIASTKPDYIGQVFNDDLSLSILTLSAAGPHVLLDSSNLIDAVAPIMANNRLVGWVRIGRSRDTLNGNLTGVLTAGVAIGIVLIFMISILASLLAKRMVSGLNRLVKVANDAEQGYDFLRIDDSRKDEIGLLARHLYQAFDTISAENKEKIESEKRFNSIVESSHIAIAIYDKNGKMTLLNHKFISTFGYNQTEIPTLDDWWPLAYPDPSYREYVANTWLAAVERCQRDNTEFEPQEYKVANKNGDVLESQFRMAVIGSDSLVILNDITARKAAEMEANKLSQAVYQAGESILITDCKGVIEYVNPAFTSLTGYDVTEAVGKKARHLDSNSRINNCGKRLNALFSVGVLGKERQRTEKRAVSSIRP